MNKFTNEAFNMLVGESVPSGEDLRQIRMIFEDATSPVTRTLQTKLFQSVIDKSHIDFGDIPRSSGDIKDYSGYSSMMETIGVLKDLASVEKNHEVSALIKIIEDAVSNITMLAPNYSKGFMNHSDYVETEYNTYVYTCVQALTSILYNYVEYVSNPMQGKSFKITLNNTKNRADKFYFDQLIKYNNIVKSSPMNYRKMLDKVSSSGRENFTGVEWIGIATIATVALSIVPVTRELIYRFYKMRDNLSSMLEMQATFLEMNRACLESNTALDISKKKKIVEKQDKLRNKLISIASKLRVNSAKASINSKKELQNDNKAFSIDEIKDSISNSPIELI